MKKFIVFDKQGVLKYRLIEGLHKIPADAKPVSEELWKQTLKHSDSVWSIDNQGVISERLHVPPAMPFKALISNQRYDHEIAGITFNDMPFNTDRVSQSLLNGAAIQAMLDHTYRIRWKTKSGFVDLTAEQILAAAAAVQKHVQACFDREAHLWMALEDGSFTPEMAKQGWPGAPVAERPTLLDNN